MSGSAVIQSFKVGAELHTIARLRRRKQGKQHEWKMEQDSFHDMRGSGFDTRDFDCKL